VFNAIIGLAVLFKQLLEHRHEISLIVNELHKDWPPVAIKLILLLLKVDDPPLVPVHVNEELLSKTSKRHDIPP